MNNVICFPGARRPTISCLDGGGDGLFVQRTDARGYKETFGPFPDPSAAREFAANISKQSGVQVDWGTFPTAYTPDPRNGEVYATEAFVCRRENGQWIEEPDGFMVVHMSHSGNSVGGCAGFETLEEAQAAAVRIAREYNAVLS
jgi:hypothetical protein